MIVSLRTKRNRKRKRPSKQETRVRVESGQDNTCENKDRPILLRRLFLLLLVIGSVECEGDF